MPVLAVAGRQQVQEHVARYGLLQLQLQRQEENASSTNTTNRRTKINHWFLQLHSIRNTFVVIGCKNTGKTYFEKLMKSVISFIRRN
jgi:hypothetical protein